VGEKAATRMQKLRPQPSYGLAEWRGLVRTAERNGFDWCR